MLYNIHYCITVLYNIVLYYCTTATAKLLDVWVCNTIHHLLRDFWFLAIYGIKQHVHALSENPRYTPSCFHVTCLLYTSRCV